MGEAARMFSKWNMFDVSITAMVLQKLVLHGKSTIKAIVPHAKAVHATNRRKGWFVRPSTAVGGNGYREEGCNW